MNKAYVSSVINIAIRQPLGPPPARHCLVRGRGGGGKELADRDVNDGRHISLIMMRAIEFGVVLYHGSLNTV